MRQSRDRKWDKRHGEEYNGDYLNGLESVGSFVVSSSSSALHVPLPALAKSSAASRIGGHVSSLHLLCAFSQH